MSTGQQQDKGLCDESDAKVSLVEGLCSQRFSSTADGVSLRKSQILLGIPFAPKAATNHLEKFYILIRAQVLLPWTENNLVPCSPCYFF